jgi:hypothetical protein
MYFYNKCLSLHSECLTNQLFTLIKKTLFFSCVAGKLNRKRGAGLRLNEVDRKMEVDSYKCYFTNCTAPPDPDTVPPTCTRASDAALYSDTTIWDK